MVTINNEPFHIVRRTNDLLSQYIGEKHENSYDVTLSVLALGGVLSYLTTLNKFPKTLQTDPSMVAKECFEKDSNYTLSKTCRHIRNAIAHSHIEVLGQKGAPIDTVLLKDYANKTQFKKNKPNFRIEITVKDLKCFLSELVSFVVSSKL